MWKFETVTDSRGRERSALHYDHDDSGAGYLGFSHASCNSNAAKPSRTRWQRVIVTMPDDLVAAVDAAAEAEERSRAFMIRRAVAQTYSPTARVAASVGLAAVQVPEEPHVFQSQPGNALRCVCGRRKAEH